MAVTVISWFLVRKKRALTIILALKKANFANAEKAEE